MTQTWIDSKGEMEVILRREAWGSLAVVLDGRPYCVPLNHAYVDGRLDPTILEPVGLTTAQVEEMYRYLAIANYEDRFVIPTTHREYAENAFNVRGGCGFSFGNGCSEGTTETSLFGSEKKRTIPIKAEL